MPKYLITLLSCILLSGCSSGITYDSGTGGIIRQHFTMKDYGEIMQIASGYCQTHGLGKPDVRQISVGCVALSCGTEFDQYEFKCAYK